MKTFVATHELSSLWKECKYTLADLNFQIVQENFLTRRMSARKSSSNYPNTVLLEVSIEEQSNLLILSVDAVQNNLTDGMLSSQPSFELIFIRQLLRAIVPNSEDNSFKLRQEDYLGY